MNTRKLVAESALAQKYARAFINVFGSVVTEQEVERIEQLITFLASHKEALFYVQLSFLDEGVVQKAFFKLLDQFKLNKVFEKLIDVLSADKRLFLLPDVLAYIMTIVREQSNTMSFTITSSHNLSKDQIGVLLAFLEHETHKKIIYTIKIDKRLIAGISLMSDTLGWEYSVRKQLETLKYVR
jgi:F-type H+-transporting ATPase subunit delta